MKDTMLKCRLCGVNNVLEAGELCDSCKMKLGLPVDVSPIISMHDENKEQKKLPNDERDWNPIDPFAEYMNKTQMRNNEDIINCYERTVIEEHNLESSEMIEDNKFGEVTDSVGSDNFKYITRGYIKNIRYNSEESNVIGRWFRALFFGIPFSVDDYTTLFQVFPDFTGTSRNQTGTVCDQVVMYGRILRGTLSDNNEVEVYGFRDRHNNIVASAVTNVASGTSCKASGTISGMMVRLITVLLILAIAGIILKVGWGNIVEMVMQLMILVVVLLVIWGMIKRFFRRRF